MLKIAYFLLYGYAMIYFSHYHWIGRLFLIFVIMNNVAMTSPHIKICFHCELLFL